MQVGEIVVYSEQLLLQQILHVSFSSSRRVILWSGDQSCVWIRGLIWKNEVSTFAHASSTLPWLTLYLEQEWRQHHWTLATNQQSPAANSPSFQRLSLYLDWLDHIVRKKLSQQLDVRPMSEIPAAPIFYFQSLKIAVAWTQTFSWRTFADVDFISMESEIHQTDWLWM